MLQLPIRIYGDENTVVLVREVKAENRMRRDSIVMGDPEEDLEPLAALALVRYVRLDPCCVP